MFLSILEDIYETTTVKNINEIFELEASFIKQIDKNEIEANRLQLLKMHNTMLNRISPSLCTQIRGRIQLLLSEIFPIFDKSGVNFKGYYNTSDLTLNNITKEDKSCLIDSYFYNQFWILQKYISNPFLVSSFYLNDIVISDKQ